MRIKVKICGLKTLRDIEIVNKYSVDYAGFVFAPSKRQISVEEAKVMIKVLRKDIQAVGVFVNTPYDEVNKITEYCGIHIAQLHGNEEPRECEKVNVPVWKAISITEKVDLEKTEHYNSVSGILLDGKEAGSGKIFNWEVATDISDKHFTILAGGLTTENLKKAILKIKPHVVDVSSGVESNLRKDEDKIEKFIKEAKKYEYK